MKYFLLFIFVSTVSCSNQFGGTPKHKSPHNRRPSKSKLRARSVYKSQERQKDKSKEKSHHTGGSLHKNSGEKLPSSSRTPLDPALVSPKVKHKDHAQDAVCQSKEEEQPCIQNTSYAPTCSYKECIVHKHQVYLSKDLQKNKLRAHEVLDTLASDLKEIAKRVHPDRVDLMTQAPIWIENGNLDSLRFIFSKKWLIANNMNPDKQHSIEMLSAKNYLEYRKTQPFIVLHELSHHYMDKMLSDKEKESITTIYNTIKQQGSLKSICHIQGQYLPAYALTNELEFFAEMSEAYWGLNDYYPFNIKELKDNFPDVYLLMQRTWDTHEGDEPTFVSYINKCNLDSKIE